MPETRVTLNDWSGFEQETRDKVSSKARRASSHGRRGHTTNILPNLTSKSWRWLCHKRALKQQEEDTEDVQHRTSNWQVCAEMYRQNYGRDLIAPQESMTARLQNIQPALVERHLWTAERYEEIDEGSDYGTFKLSTSKVTSGKCSVDKLNWWWG